MQRQVSCECGYVVRNDDEDRLVTDVLQHVRTDHPDLVDQVSTDLVKGWIELVP